MGFYLFTFKVKSRFIYKMNSCEKWILENSLFSLLCVIYIASACIVKQIEVIEDNLW